MSNRYLAWTLIFSIGGLQAYLVAHGSEYFTVFETVAVPFCLHSFSGYLFEHYVGHWFYIVVTLTLALPVVTSILSWVILGLRRKAGWYLALVIDLYFGFPSLVLISINLAYNLKYHHLRLQNNPEVLLFFLALLHILLLRSPPIRILIFPHPAHQDFVNDLTPPITTAR